MANRMKEDEKNEKIIRGLLKLPANRRCINCNSLGPQYVCTNFWTFVCTTCSGIHREFTHRVKSVSMAKFTSQEVSALQGGGNEHAKEIYLKEWDSQRHAAPDSSNVERLRDFIRHVYVDRRYTGERSVDRPPRVKMGEKEDSHENRRADTYRGGSRSPPYEDTYDRRYGERSGLGGRNDDRNYRYNYDERRSPGYEQETRYGDYRRSPVRFEVVDDRRRDDRFGNGRRSEERRYSDGESKLEGRSPNSQKDLDGSSPPMVRPVRDILGGDVPPLRIGEPPKANGGKAIDGSAHTQKTTSSSSLRPIDGSSAELKRVNSGSLIDFNADPGPPDAAAAAAPAQPAAISMAQSVTQSTTSSSIDNGNWASFDFGPQTQTQTQVQAPSTANTLESVLSQLSAPVSAPASNMALSFGGGAPTNAPVGNMSMLPISGAAPSAGVSNVSTMPFSGGVAAAPVGNMSAIPISGSASAAPPGGMMSMLPVSGGDFFVKANDGRQSQNIQQQQPSLFATTGNLSASPQFTQSVSGAPNNQTWNSSLVQNAQGQPTATAQPSQAATKLAQEQSGGVASLPAASEVKNNGRKELPEDLFAPTYSAVPVPVPGWHTGLSHGMGFGMQYPTAVQSLPTFLQPSKPSNPFDLNNEPTLAHAPLFPSMASLQGALPNMAAHPGLLRTSSLGTPGTHSPRWMTPQSPSYASAGQSPSYASAGQSPSYASAVPPSAYMGQQVPTNIPALGHQGGGGFGGETTFYGSVNTDRHLAGRYSQPATPNSFSSPGGNPFG